MGRNTELQCMQALLGEKLYEIIEDYCKTQNIDPKDFVKGCVTTILGVKHVPEHYEPLETNQAPPDIESWRLSLFKDIGKAKSLDEGDDNGTG